MMHRSNWTPSIVPSGWDQNVYLVVDCDRHGACVWTEAYVEATDIETVIADLMSGQYSDPQRVVTFNVAEHWAKDVSDDVAREIRRRADLCGGPTDFARLGMMQALYPRGQRVYDRSRKDPHWGRRKLARDQ